MNRLLFVAAFLLAALPVLGTPIIGIYADEAASICDVDVVAYVPVDVYVVAHWTGEEVPGGMTACEFKLENFPQNVGYPTGQVTVTHTTDLVIGTLWTDYSAAWSTPQGAGAGIYTIASIEILAFDAEWIGADHVSVVAPGDDCDCLNIVDANFDIVDAVGQQFTFNCSTPPCSCETAAEASTWSSVKALF